MGEGDQRRTKRTARYNSRELAVLSKKQTPSAKDWDDKVAAGSQKVPLVLGSRTKTVDDPLTTRILAEVARRTTTVDVSPGRPDQPTGPNPIDQVTDAKLGEEPPEDPA